MKKKVILAFIALMLSAPVWAQQEITYVYTDATTLPVFGKVLPDTYGPFTRLPESLKGVSRDPVWRLGINSAGLFVRFSSNGGIFRFRWTSTFAKPMDNMAPCGSRGLALYVYDKGEWVYAGTARPNLDSKESEFTVSCSSLSGTFREYMLYLSLYDGVQKLEIGVPQGKVVTTPMAASPKADKPVIIYGSSILQGASASHPGMASTNQISRRLNRVVINLGFSGNGKLDYEIAELIASHPDPGVIVLDNVPNCTPEMLRERQIPFYEIIRKAHPSVPIVFIDGPYYPGTRFDGGKARNCKNKTEAFKEAFNKIKATGDKNVYFVSSEKILEADNVGTIEGTHFTDIGFLKYADVLTPVLQKLLK